MAKWDMKTEPADALECIRYLRAKLETAWDDALEEAAIEVAAMAETDAYMNKVWRNGCRDAAQAIREMKGEKP